MMDSYPAYREPPLARSPIERSNWASRDDARQDRMDRPDSFYRGRSPGADRRLYRDRSRSPMIDRYEPADRARNGRARDRERERDVYRDERRRVPSPAPAHIDRYVPGQDAAPVITVNPLADPNVLPYQVGFSYYSEWWRMNERIKEDKERAKTGRRSSTHRRDNPEDREKEKATIQVAYDAYKEELQGKMARTFVSEHKNEQWFQERYTPEVRDGIRQQLNEFRRGNYTRWEQDLASGLFDEFTLEGIPKSESNGAGGVVEKEEGETSAVAEVLGVGDLVPSKGSEIRDDDSTQPTLLIKTIAPNVSRQNLEAFCKEHLGEGQGGFRWLSTSDPNPSKKYHRIGWVMLNAASENSPSTEQPEIQDADGDVKATDAKPVPTTAEKALEAINGKVVKDETRGDFTVHCGVHNPPSVLRKKALWDLFSAPERIEKDLDLASRLVSKYEEDFGSDFNAVLKIEERVDELKEQGKLKPAVTAPTTKKPAKIKQALGMDEAMDVGEDVEESEEEDEEEDGSYQDEVDDEDLLIKKKQLDLMVEYLRRVFNFCFFCVFESDSVHELGRKCPSGHLRRPRNSLTTAGKAAARASAAGAAFPGKKATENADEGDVSASPVEQQKTSGKKGMSKAEQQLQRAFNWVKTFEDKLMQILEPEAVDLRQIGGRAADEGVQEELRKFVKQEDEHKFRCRVPECTKLFKEEHFWRKHVEKRHPEWFAGLRKDFELVNTYVMDPSHIAPSRSDANSNGHFPSTAGHMPSGTPRGFSLQNFNMAGMPPLGNGTFPANLPAFFAGHPMQAANGWSNGGDSRGNAAGGPIRRGGRFPNNRSGPYDRRPNQRWNDSARLEPPHGGRRGGMASGAGRWGDGAQGGAAVGPREAVQGRSIKSYEDLDAVAGGGSGELNY